MSMEESIEKINSYFANYKNLTVEEKHNSPFVEDIMKCISFKKEVDKKTFNTNSDRIEVLYYPIDMETMREKLKYEYEVISGDNLDEIYKLVYGSNKIFDDNSDQFYKLICGSKNILIQYMSLLPIEYELSPIGIVILRYVQIS